jgi:hypothetical protein
VGGDQVDSSRPLRERHADALTASPQLCIEANDELLVLGGADDRAGH